MKLISNLNHLFYCLLILETTIKVIIKTCILYHNYLDTMIFERYIFLYFANRTKCTTNKEIEV